MDQPSASWLTALASHPIFSTSSVGASTSSFAIPAPPSPNASSIRYDEDDEEEEQDHNESTFRHGLEHPNSSGRKSKACIVRNTELALAVGKTVRIASLAAFKTKIESARSSQSSSSAGASNQYKTLNTPALDFEIYSLVPSTNDRFLACVGRSQLVVLDLPRKGWEGLQSGLVECSHDPIGSFYHTPSSASIAKVAWHHWADKDSTLLVLTSDGLLREYDVLQDVEEPTQIVDFVGTGTRAPEASRHSASQAANRKASERSLSSRSKDKQRETSSTDLTRYGDYAPSDETSGTPKKLLKKGIAYLGDEEGEDVAVSFSFGSTHAGEDSGWAPFTVYCLMQNSDLYSVCPYLPKSATIPADYLSTLSAYTSARLDLLAREEGISFADKQMRELRYAQQLKFLNSLLIQGASANEIEDGRNNGSIRVQYPKHLRHLQVLKQGPFNINPIPQELDNQQQSLACDLAISDLCQTGNTTSYQESISVYLVAYSDGRVDVLLECERIEPIWAGPSLYDIDAPMLLAYTSCDLFDSAPISSEYFTIVPDLEQADNFYLYHAYGAHSISLRTIRDSLLPPPLIDNSSAPAQPLLRKKLQPDVSSIFQSSGSADAHPTRSSQSAVVTLLVINEVYLGYALFLLTAAGSAVTVELSSPSTLQEVPGKHLTLSNGKANTTAMQLLASADKQSYVAFPDSSQFDLPQLLVKKGSTPTTRFASPPANARANRVSPTGEIELTVDALRFVGQTVEKLDAQIKALIQAGNLVQERLELQLKELPRQASKCHEVDDALQEKSTILKDEYSARLKKIKDTQGRLEARADKLLQRLIDNSQPELSSFERRWMEELDRIQIAVGTPSSEKQERNAGLQGRLQKLQEQLEVLRPQLEHSKRTGSATVSADDRRLGAAQRQQIETALSEETRLLSEVKSKIDRITTRLSRSRGHVEPS